jgi:raffinose/stachyose/melibiose transport system permease protein
LRSGELISALQEDQRLVGLGKKRSRRVVGRWTPWCFLAPALLIYTAFLIYPAIRSLYYSLTSWNGLSKPKFVGLRNYATALTSASSLSALAHNALWSGVMVTVPTALGLGLAVLLNRPGRVRAFTQGVAFLPGVLSVVGVALVWDWLYDPQSGFVNEVLQKLHVIGTPIDWLGGGIAEIALLIPGIWIAVGLPLVLFLAGLQVIPPELYEAARIDGAQRWQLFRHVSLPGLRNTTIVVLALAMINSLLVFGLIYAMTAGGPGNSTQVLGTWVYTITFQYGQIGYGSALAWLLALTSFLVTAPYVLWVTRRD